MTDTSLQAELAKAQIELSALRAEHVKDLEVIAGLRKQLAEHEEATNPKRRRKQT